MRGVTGKKFNCSPSDKISTHTPHARRDEAQYQMTTDYVISTHTPHARRDKRVRFSLVASIPFQLTRLMRGVTLYVPNSARAKSISTHTPHARRDPCGADYRLFHNISTHTPHARRDEIRTEIICIDSTFQLTRLMRGVTRSLPKHSCPP